jgi:hypothetical protein
MLPSLLNNKVQLFLLAIFLILTNTALSQSKNWQRLPFKINVTPRAFYFDSLTDKLIISGEFTRVDSVKADMFLWDGTKVSFLNGSNYQYHPLDIVRRFNGKLYIGGDGLFLYADTGLIRIDSNGNSNQVYTLYEYNHQLLVAGHFGNFVNPKKEYPPISKLDSFQWVSLNGIDTVLKDRSDGISSLITYKNQLYAAGNISPIGRIKEILRWDNTKWTDVGGGIPGGGDEWVMDMEIYKGELYVAGRFFRATGAIDNNIARWDGSQWKPVGGGVDGAIISDLQVFNNELWVVGSFTSAGGVPAEHIAKWDGIQWCGLGTKFDNSLSCLGVYKNELYMGGGFTSIDGNDSIQYIAKWVGGNYSDTCGAIDYTGIQESGIENSGLKIYPDPCQNKLNLEFEASFRGQPLKINIYNAIGQNIFVSEGKILENIYILDLSFVGTGVYFCEIELNDKIIRKKFLKY